MNHKKIDKKKKIIAVVPARLTSSRLRGKHLYKANQKISTVKVYKGKAASLNVGMTEDQYITIPAGQYQRLQLTTKIPDNLVAPIHLGDKIGELIIQLDQNVVQKQPIYALETIEKGGLITRFKDSMRLTWKNIFHS